MEIIAPELQNISTCWEIPKLIRKCKIDRNGLLTVAHINIRSLRNKVEQVDRLLRTTGIDILAVSETWLTDKDAQNVLEINGYVLFRKDGVGQGSGLVLYIKEALNPVQNTDLENATQMANFEKLCATVRTVGCTVNVTAFYRNFHSCCSAAEFPDNFGTLAETISLSPNHIVLGDSNVDLLSGSAPARQLLRVCTDFTA